MNPYCNNSLFESHLLAVKQLIAINKEFRKKNEVIKENYRVVSYAMTFSTIQVNIGRMTGKSRILKEIATEKTILVVENEQQRAYHKELGIKTPVFYMADIINNGIRDDIDYDTVLIDDADYIITGKNNKRIIYEKLAKNHDVTFVLMG